MWIHVFLVVPKVLTQQTKLPVQDSKFIEERQKLSSAGKTNVEARRPGRRFVRPSLEKLEEPATETEVTGMEILSTSAAKPSSSIENEVIGDFSIPPPPPVVVPKRLISSDPEIPEGSVAAQDEINIDVPPPSKRRKESEFSEDPEANNTPLSSENPDITLPSEASEMQISQAKDELDANTVKEAEDNFLVNEESDEPQKEYFDSANPEEVQYEGDIIIEELSSDQRPKKEEINDDFSSATTEGEGDKEEGELMLDEPEQPPDDLVSDEGQHGFSPGEGAGSGDEADDANEIASSNNEQDAHDSVDTSMLTDVEDVAEDCEKHVGSSIDQATLVTEQSPDISTGAREESPVPLQQNLTSAQSIPIAPGEAGESHPGRSSRTITISESAKRNAQVRQARLAIQQQQQQQQQQQLQKSPSRGRPPSFRRGRGRGGGRG